MYWYPYTTFKTETHAAAAFEIMLKKQQTLTNQASLKPILTLSPQNEQNHKQSSHRLVQSCF